MIRQRIIALASAFAAATTQLSGCSPSSYQNETVCKIINTEDNDDSDSTKPMHPFLDNMGHEPQAVATSIDKVGDFVTRLHEIEQNKLAVDQGGYTLPPNESDSIKNITKQVIKDFREKGTKCAFISTGFSREPGHTGAMSFARVAIGFSRIANQVFISENYQGTNNRELMVKELRNETVDKSYKLIQDKIAKSGLKVATELTSVTDENEFHKIHLLAPPSI
jgi:hypothetical protein